MLAGLVIAKYCCSNKMCADERAAMKRKGRCCLLISCCLTRGGLLALTQGSTNCRKLAKGIFTKLPYWLKVEELLRQPSLTLSSPGIQNLCSALKSLS